jgi:sugar-specific transcriptional regulator TrmB
MKPSIQNETNKALASLGITEAATELYMVLLHTHDHNFAKVARQLQISRPHLYKLLAELETHELVQFEKGKGKDERLHVSPPTVILDKVREQQQSLGTIESNFTQALPQLMSAFKQGSAASKVKIVTGTKDFLKLLMSIAEEERRSLVYFGSIEHFIDCISWSNQEKWMHARVAAGMKIDALILESAEAYLLKRRDKAQLRETRILTIPDTFVTSYHVFSNKTVFWQPKAKLAILIEDQHIAQMIRAMFYALWEQQSTK